VLVLVVVVVVMLVVVVLLVLVLLPLPLLVLLPVLLLTRRPQLIEEIDMIMIAPRMPGPLVRELWLGGGGAMAQYVDIHHCLGSHAVNSCFVISAVDPCGACTPGTACTATRPAPPPTPAWRSAARSACAAAAL